MKNLFTALAGGLAFAIFSPQAKAQVYATNVSTYGDFYQAVRDASAYGSGTYTINLLADINYDDSDARVLTTQNIVNMQGTATLVINGNNHTLDMKPTGSSDDYGVNRAFFIAGGNVSISDLVIANGNAVGGKGGDNGGGGGMGAGGAIFVANLSDVAGSGVTNASNVSLNNVQFNHNTAVGGAGGDSYGATGGGGGGMGGDGGDGYAGYIAKGGGGGGGFGPGATGGSSNSDWATDASDGEYLLGGAAGSGAGDNGYTVGGIYAGGGGGGYADEVFDESDAAGGGGGIGGSNAAGSNNGGDGGWGGGGGGVTDNVGPGGDGGFGGGGGFGVVSIDHGDQAGNGGFGGGGSQWGEGGFGGGNGGGNEDAGAGGGMGAGGAIFVQKGATLSITDGSLSTEVGGNNSNSAVGGAGGA
ncbi:MAG: pectate lyase-like adhesive domain-containing protein, partial [Puniceicoccales bacterium]